MVPRVSQELGKDDSIRLSVVSDQNFKRALSLKGAILGVLPSFMVEGELPPSYTKDIEKRYRLSYYVWYLQGEEALSY
jgi:hypothetical protein